MPRLVHRNSGAVAGKKLAAHRVHDQGLAAALVGDLKLQRGLRLGTEQSSPPRHSSGSREGGLRAKPGGQLAQPGCGRRSINAQLRPNIKASLDTAIHSHLVDCQSKDDGYDCRQDLARIMRHNGQSSQSRNSSSLHSAQVVSQGPEMAAQRMNACMAFRRSP